MARVCLEIRTVSILGCTVKVVVFIDQSYEVILNRCKLLHWEFKLIGFNFLLLKESDETKFVLQQEHQRLAAAGGTSTCPAHSMNIVIGVIWRVILKYPVDLWEVKSSLGDICAEEDAFLRLTEFKVGRSPLLLLLLSVDVFDRDIYVV